MRIRVIREIRVKKENRENLKRRRRPAELDENCSPGG